MEEKQLNEDVNPQAALEWHYCSWSSGEYWKRKLFVVLFHSWSSLLSLWETLP